MNCEAHDQPTDARGECEECRIERSQRDARDHCRGPARPRHSPDCPEDHDDSFERFEGRGGSFDFGD